MSLKLGKMFTKARRKIRARGIKASRVAILNDSFNGWFNHDNGELAPGFAIDEHDTVIDVGCGDGGLLKFAGQRRAHLIATDIDTANVERAAGKLNRSQASSVKAIVSDTNPLPIADATCTRVICSEVMEHVPCPQSFIRELARVAKPKALFLLTVPHPASETLRKNFVPDEYWQSPNHLRVFTCEAFDELVTGAGLEIQRKFNKGFFWTIWWSLFFAGKDGIHDGECELLYHWSKTWHELLKSENGLKIAQSLDATLPSSQVIIARKPG